MAKRTEQIINEKISIGFVAGRGGSIDPLGPCHITNAQDKGGSFRQSAVANINFIHSILITNDLSDSHQKIS